MKEGMLGKKQFCQQCGSEMKIKKCNDRSDRWKWERSWQLKRKRHKVEKSLRCGSWFDKSNMTLEEILKLTYLCCQGLDQWQIKHKLGVCNNTVVD
mgnify:CR=1 FL=1